MKRILTSALAAGAVYALLGPVFVRCVLDAPLQDELARVFAALLGRAPRAVDAAGGSDWGPLLLHLLLRFSFGFVTASLFAVLARRRSRFGAARLAGLGSWLLGYVAFPVALYAGFGLPLLLLFVAVGYGLVETQLAAHVGALASGRKAAAP